MEKHNPVLLKEVIEELDLKKGNKILDLTLGTGGHSKEIFNKLNGDVELVCLDADENAISNVKENFTENVLSKIKIINGNFRDIRKIAKENNLPLFDRVLADLGWGSHQLNSNRGFTFNNDEPLDMCYSQKEGGCAFNAFYLVNSFKEDYLEKIIKGFGEERWAKRIAKFIVNARREKEIKTSKELADIISSAVPRALQPKKTNIATKSFQAIRIAVNDEIGALEEMINSLNEITNKEARISIISFHSIEDRIVKTSFKDMERKGIGKSLNKKITTPTKEEIERNPRARSAKLRTFIKN